MKISLNWVKEYTQADLSVDELVEKIGAQLGAVEEVVSLGEKYQGIVIAEVVECIKHPNADKLHVCKIDDGKKVKNVDRDENGYVQVVCGAPNVRAGMVVAWLPPGATVPSTFDKEPFVLEARELRGVVSNGMLASAAELGISDDHSGLLEINPHDAKPGADFAETYRLNDYIIDIENKMFTHRPDCFGILGVAREIAGIAHTQFESPKWYLKPGAIKSEHPKPLPLKLENEVPELVPRFTALTMRVEHNGPSPVWMQTYLMRVGIRPISTLVDITNYLMYLTGQPLHAYDYDKVRKIDGSEHATLMARLPKKGEKLTLLNGKEIEPHKQAVMIATATKLIGVGGIMGGADTEVDEDTRNIIIECANFDMYSIRKTSMEHGLFTDASTRFNKGQSPHQTVTVITKAAEMVKQLVGGSVAGELTDVDHTKASSPDVATSAPFINERLGLTLTAHQMAGLLENVEFDVEQRQDTLRVCPPFWRTDIEIPEDIVEEVGRLYGYDQLPLELPKRDLTPAVVDGLLAFKARVREVLADAGANEALTYGFVHSDLLQKAGQNKSHAYELSNALSPELQYYRLSLTPSLLDKVHPNIKAGFEEFALFEVGKVHVKGLMDEDEPSVPSEEQRLALVYACESKRWKQLHGGAAYYQAQRFVVELLDTLAIPFRLTPGEKHQPASIQARQTWAPYEPARTAYIRTMDNQPLGMVGEYRADVTRALKLPRQTAGFELDLSQLMRFAGRKAYSPLPRFPRVQQDISLKVPAGTLFGELYAFIQAATPYPEDTYHEWQAIDIYEPEDKKHRHITLRLRIASYERTMTAEQVNTLLDATAAAAAKKFGATRL